MIVFSALRINQKDSSSFKGPLMLRVASFSHGLVFKGITGTFSKSKTAKQSERGTTQYT